MRCGRRAGSATASAPRRAVLPRCVCSWSWLTFESHTEDAEARLRDGLFERQREPQRETAARVDRIDDAIVPQPRGGVVRIALLLVLRADRRLEGSLFLGAPCAALGLDRVTAHGREHVRGLLAAHDGDARVRPGPEEAR